MIFWSGGNRWGWGDRYFGHWLRWRIRRATCPILLRPPATPCHQTNTPLFTPPFGRNVVFPVKTAVWTNPTRGARPLWQRVAVRGRRWQNLLPLGVSRGCGVGSFLDLPRPAISCQHSVRHFLRHRLKANSYGDVRRKGFELPTGNCHDGSAQREGRAGVSSRNQIVGWVGDALKIKVTAPPEASVPTTSRSSAVARHRPR